MFANLVDNDYLQSAPVNPFVAATVGTVVGSAAGTGVGWVYDATTGDIFAVDAAGVIAGGTANPW
jgi:hypothetical protein